MLISCIHTLIRRTCLQCGMDFWMCCRILFAVPFTLSFVIVSMIVRKISWKLFLLFLDSPQQAWIKPREQALIIKHLQKSNQTTRQNRMKENTVLEKEFVHHFHIHSIEMLNFTLSYTKYIREVPY